MYLLQANVLRVIALLVLDALWLKTMSKVYMGAYRTVQGGKPIQVSWVPALLAYLFMIVGLLTFVKTAFDGMLFGLVVYGVYNATNAAIYTAFNKGLAVVDTLWGAFLYGFVAWLVKI